MTMTNEQPSAVRSRDVQASVLMQVFCDADWRPQEAYDGAVRELIEAEQRGAQAERRKAADVLAEEQRISNLRADTVDRWTNTCAALEQEKAETVAENARLLGLITNAVDDAQATHDAISLYQPGWKREVDNIVPVLARLKSLKRAALASAPAQAGEA